MRYMEETTAVGSVYSDKKKSAIAVCAVFYHEVCSKSVHQQHKYRRAACAVFYHKRLVIVRASISNTSYHRW